jgi:hypothetical protein
VSLTIKKFLDETSLDPFVSDKRKRMDYRCSSASTLEVILAKTWFGCGTMHSLDSSQIKSIFRFENVAHRQAAILSSAVITYACAEPRGARLESAASRLFQYRASGDPSTFLNRDWARNAGGMAEPQQIP